MTIDVTGVPPSVAEKTPPGELEERPTIKPPVLVRT